MNGILTLIKLPLFIIRYIVLILIALVYGICTPINYKRAEKKGPVFCDKKIDELDLQQFKYRTEEENVEMLGTYPIENGDIELGAKWDVKW